MDIIQIIVDLCIIAFASVSVEIKDVFSWRAFFVVVFEIVFGISDCGAELFRTKINVFAFDRTLGVNA